MKADLKWLAIAVAIISVVGLATASNTTSHNVTVVVSAINEIALTGGNITLTINAATAGSEPNNAVNNTCALVWTVNTTGKKITVATNQAAFNHTLVAEVENLSGVGVDAGPVTLTNSAQDFVTGIEETTGGCTIDYTASVTAAQGITAGVVHTITFTITS